MRYVGICHKCKARIQLDATPTEIPMRTNEHADHADFVCVDRPSWESEPYASTRLKIDVQCPICGTMTEIAYIDS